jgi:hypothetical protein
MEDGMKPLEKNPQNWLLTFHIFFVAVWLGAALSANVLILFNKDMPNGEALAALHGIVKKLDILIVPSGIGVVLTSLIVSTMTKWGFTKFRWIIVLWVILIAQLVFGIVVLGPLTESLLSISLREGLAALENPVYIQDHTWLFVLGTVQVLV